MPWVKRNIGNILAVYVAVVFLQSLFFKFTDAPETQHIFNTLEMWAVSSFGISGLFTSGGAFGRFGVGSAELIAATLLLAGLVGSLKPAQLVGGLLATGIMTGAIFFHLFTPLGIEVQGDGGFLFANAVAIWFSGLALAYLRRATILKPRPIQ